MAFFDDPEIFQTLLSNLSVGIYFVDRDWKVAYWNRGAEKISGFSWQDVLGRPYLTKLFVQCDHTGAVIEASQLLEAMQNGSAREADVLLLHKEGYRIPVHVCAVPLRNSHGKLVGAAEMFELQRLPVMGGRTEAKNDTLFLVDRRTGLPDRESTRVRIERALVECTEQHIPFSLMCIEIDGFERFQATHGSCAATTALKVVAHTISSALRPDDFVGMWEPSQFLAVLRYCERSGLQRVGERVRSIVSCSQVEWWGEALTITVSIGSASGTSEDDLDSVFARARDALLQSRNQGGNHMNIAAGELKTSEVHE